MMHYNISFIILSFMAGGFIALLTLRLITLIYVARAKEKNALLTLSSLMLGSSLWLVQILHGLAFPFIEKPGLSLNFTFISWLCATGMAMLYLFCASQTFLQHYWIWLTGLLAGMCGLALFYFNVLSMQIQPAITFSATALLLTLPLSLITSAIALYFLCQFKFKAHLYRFRQKLWMAAATSLVILLMQSLLDHSINMPDDANSIFPINNDSLLIGLKIGLGFICLFIMPFMIAIFYDKFKFNTFLWRYLSLEMPAKDNGAANSSRENAEVKKPFDQTMLAEELLTIFSYDALILEYQIKIDSQTRMPVGAEAFVRWVHPKKGLLAPAEFMPLAVQLDMHDDIDAWVIEESCRMLHRLKTAKINCPISVNLSPHQLRQSGLVAHITSVLKRFDLSHKQISFEIPESTIFNDATLLNHQLDAFKTAGIHIAVDDFGTQFSTLSQLQTLTVSTLKLGPALTADIAHNTKTHRVAQAVIQLAHALGLKVVAENVETEEQRRCLTALACDEMQGFIIAPPLPEHRFLVLLKNLQAKTTAS